jgi:hypothetical protein
MVRYACHALALTLGLMLPAGAIAQSQTDQWNYFGSCGSDDTILAVDGKWFSLDDQDPRPDPNKLKSLRWVNGGTYRTLRAGEIVIFSSGGPPLGAYKHKSLLKSLCGKQNRELCLASFA